MWKHTIPGHMEDERWIPEHDEYSLLDKIKFLLIAAAIVIGIIYFFYLGYWLYLLFLIPLFIIIWVVLHIIGAITEGITGLRDLLYGWGNLSRSEFFRYFIELILINLFIAILIIQTGFDVWIQSIGLASIVGLTWLAINLFSFYTAQIRRFHDLDKSGWYILLSFIPLVNFLVLIYLLTKKGRSDY